MTYLITARNALGPLARRTSTEEAALQLAARWTQGDMTVRIVDVETGQVMRVSDMAGRIKARHRANA